MGNPIVHIEIPAINMEKAKEFYEKVFGWKISERLGYVTFETGTPPGGTLQKVDKVISGKSVTFYIAIDDIDMKLAQIEKAGGKIVKKKTELPHLGYEAEFTDLSGNVLRLFSSPKQNPKNR